MPRLLDCSLEVHFEEMNAEVCVLWKFTNKLVYLGHF